MVRLGGVPPPPSCNPQLFILKQYEEAQLQEGVSLTGALKMHDWLGELLVQHPLPDLTRNLFQN